MLLFVALSIIAFLVGIFAITEATMGVGAVAAACYFGILARITQAERDAKKALEPQP